VSGPPPEGNRYFESAPGIVTLVPDDGRPDPCPFGSAPGHDRQGCVACLRLHVWARRVAAQGDDDGSGWAPESLIDVEPVPPPTVLEMASDDFLFRRGWVTLIHGAQGSGKTPLTYLAVVEQVRAGNLAMIVDYEMAKPHAVATLRELGLTDHEIAAGVYYRYQPPPISPAARSRVVTEVAARGRDLAVVVVDSLTESMATVPGMDDNNALDVTTWGAELPGWLADQFGAAVLVIDHSGVNDGPRPSGSHKKREFPQFHVWCRKDSPFSRANAEGGRSTLLVQKDRSGEREIGKAVAHLRTQPGGSFYLAPVEAPQGGSVEVPLDLQPDGATDEEVYADLVAQGEKGALSTEITGRGKRGQFRRAALYRLEAAGRAAKVPVPGSAQGVRWWADRFHPR
jgi:hypothetical protein